MAEEEVGRMIGAHAAPGGERFVALMAVAVDERQDLLHDVAVVLLVAAGAVGRMCAPVGPRLAVHAVHGEELDFARCHEWGAGAHHAEVLILIERPALGREDQDRLARLAVDFDLHILSQVGAPPLVIFGMHVILAIVCWMILGDRQHFVQIGRPNQVVVVSHRQAEHRRHRLVVHDTIAKRAHHLVVQCENRTC